MTSSIKSEFHEDPKDRRWAFEYCDLVPKCGVFESLVFGDPTETDQADTFLKAKTINNLEMNNPLHTSVEISEIDTSRYTAFTARKLGRQNFSGIFLGKTKKMLIF